MLIKNNLLFIEIDKQADFKLTPNRRLRYIPQYLVMHYTAVTTFNSTLNHFQRRAAQASAHLLIGRDGQITQFAPFNIVTWHAGKSQFNGLNGLNEYAIGIELVNGGRLSKSGETYSCAVDRKEIPQSEVIIATHKNETLPAAWHQYTAIQLEVSMEIATLLVKKYGLKDVVGHEDISPIRKSDPGPAFPMSSFRSRAMGRKNETLDEYITSSALNIRTGPGTLFPPITQPLPKGTKVHVLKTESTWSFVEVQESVHGIMDLEGWVASKFLKPQE